MSNLRNLHEHFKDLAIAVIYQVPNIHAQCLVGNASLKASQPKYFNASLK